MLTLRLCIVLSFCIVTKAFAGQASWDKTLWNPVSQTQVNSVEQDQMWSKPAVFVVGEEHYNPPVQAAEAWLIRTIAEQLPDKSQLILGWEFLNTENRFTINDSYSRYRSLEITTAEFLQHLFPGGPASTEYAPVLEAARDHAAVLIPTNLSRAQKRPVTQGGMEALDPSLRPQDFALGGPIYWERFKEAMGPHPLPYPIENYFAAQSLTDEVMATELLRSGGKNSRILITGAFHGDYRQGVVTSLERRLNDLPVIYVRVLDAKDLTENELLALFVHPHYGPIADIVLVVNEPRQSPEH